MENQLELNDELTKLRMKLTEERPEAMNAFMTFRDKVYRDGALSHKVKRLIALGAALRVGCTGCIIAQTKQSIEAGATKDEVLEAIEVAIAIGGTTTMAWSMRAVKVLEELGKL